MRDWTDLDNRRTYLWGQEDHELAESRKYMVSIHKENAAFRRGSLKKSPADRQLVSYGRLRGNNRCVVAVNSSATNRTVKIPVWEVGICDNDRSTRVMMMYTEGYNVGAMDCPMENGILTSEMYGNSGVVLVSNEGERRKPVEKNEQAGQSKQLEQNEQVESTE